MAKTVIEAFNEFLKEKVNLDSEQTDTARKSRAWLVKQIHNFTSTDENFPKLYSEKDIFFGSFKRRTKKRALDDIDIMICLSGEGASYSGLNEEIEVIVPESATKLRNLCDDDKLNSTKVINKFINSLKSVSQYNSAEMHKNQAAATLQLKSYTWNFDIVPCFITQEDYLKNTYYLIPDGKGKWMKTDPRIDAQRVTNTNQKHDGNVLNVIRTIKYWNKRPTMPSIPSYVLENMILDYYDQKQDTASRFVDMEIPDVLAYISVNIYMAVMDPKGIQGDLNKLSFEERQKISNRADGDCKKAKQARQAESDKDYKKSIGIWKEIFGDEFPEYTGE